MQRSTSCRSITTANRRIGRRVRALRGSGPSCGGARGLAATADLEAELAELAEALVDDGLSRVVWGELQDFRWQVETFGFHLASLELRQHADALAAAEVALGDPRGERAHKPPVDAELPGAP